MGYGGHTHTHIHTRTHTCMHTHTHTHIHTRTHTHTYACTHIHIRTHTHTHKHTPCCKVSSLESFPMPWWNPVPLSGFFPPVSEDRATVKHDMSSITEPSYIYPVRPCRHQTPIIPQSWAISRTLYTYRRIYIILYRVKLCLFQIMHN